MENSIKASLQSITGNMKRAIVKMHALVINAISGCIAQLQCIITLHFQNTFQVEKSIISIHVSTAITLLSHQNHNTCTANHHLHDSGESNGEQS